MGFSENNKVNEFLSDIQSVSPDKFEIIESIRKMFHKLNHDLVEDIKYGGVVFSLSGSLVGGIYLYKEHLSIEFSNGAELSDPTGLLEGKGKKRRHLKIVEKRDLKSKKLSSFVKEAVTA